MADDIVWPRKTRELHSHHFDSTTWNDLVFRDDDTLSAEECAEYERRAETELGAECAHWLATGEGRPASP